MTLSRERMCEYQRERRKNLRLEGKPVGHRKVVLLQPILDIEKLKGHRRSSIPLDFLTPCIYFLFLGDEIVYVGQSTSVVQRIVAHRNGTIDSPKKDFDSLVVLESSKERVNDEELAYIRQFSPRYNKAGVLPRKEVEMPIVNLPCPTCRDAEIRIGILRGRVAMLEKEVRELRLLVPKQASVYKLGRVMGE